MTKQITTPDQLQGSSRNGRVINLAEASASFGPRTRRHQTPAVSLEGITSESLRQLSSVFNSLNSPSTSSSAAYERSALSALTDQVVGHWFGRSDQLNPDSRCFNLYQTSVTNISLRSDVFHKDTGLIMAWDDSIGISSNLNRVIAVLQNYREATLHHASNNSFERASLDGSNKQIETLLRRECLKLDAIPSNANFKQDNLLIFPRRT